METCLHCKEPSTDSAPYCLKCGYFKSQSSQQKKSDPTSLLIKAAEAKIQNQENKINEIKEILKSAKSQMLLLIIRCDSDPYSYGLETDKVIDDTYTLMDKIERILSSK